jgi:hypothetical protein
MHFDKTTPCPWCGTELNAAAGISDKANTPTPGDLSICIKCAGMLCFADDLIPQKATLEEIADLDDDSRITLQRAREFILERA